MRLEYLVEFLDAVAGNEEMDLLEGESGMSMKDADRQPATSDAGAWVGRDLGSRTVSYDERDAILYALAVGAAPDQLDLVFEKRLRVLPTFALTLAQWAPDVPADAGAYGTNPVHGRQSLRSFAPLPRSGEITMRARVGNVWDKGSAAVFEVVVDSDHFTATWGIFAPGRGGFGGDRGPSSGREGITEPVHDLRVVTMPNQAALYRLLGDRHDIHIDPAAATGAGLPRPLLHGLCTLAATTLPMADALGAHPADLSALDGRFSAPAFPGESLDVRCAADGRFETAAGQRAVITGGNVAFAA